MTCLSLKAKSSPFKQSQISSIKTVFSDQCVHCMYVFGFFKNSGLVFILTYTNILKEVNPAAATGCAASIISFAVALIYVTLDSQLNILWTSTFQTAPDPVLRHTGAEGRNEHSLPAPQCARERELPSILISRSSQLQALREFAPSSEPAI